MSLPPEPNVPQFTATVKHEILGKKSVKIQLQGQLLIALEDMARDRREDIGQVIKDVLEQRLVRDGYLPDWWFKRQGTYH